MFGAFKHLFYDSFSVSHFPQHCNTRLCGMAQGRLHFSPGKGCKCSAEKKLTKVGKLKEKVALGQVEETVDLR